MSKLDAASRHKKYRDSNPEKCKAYAKKYYEDNIEKCKAQSNKYYEDNTEKCRDVSRKYHEDNPEQCKKTRKKFQVKRRVFCEEIKIKYGCVNPKCKWDGSFDPPMLDFHHVDQTTKLFGIGGTTRRKKEIIEEINKCVVLCSNCHRSVTCGTLDASTFKKCNEKILTPQMGLP